jgi:hypothetical protein
MNNTPYFPAFRPKLAALGRCAASTRRRSAQDLEAEFGRYLPKTLFQPTDRGAGSRQRIFTVARTFWCFLWQVLQPRTPCRAVVRKVQAEVENQRFQVDESTSAYCQARKRLPLHVLQGAFRQSAGTAEDRSRHVQPFANRSVKVVDASSCQLPDTSANRKHWPYPAGQKRGCGFPVLKALVLFSLASGTFLQFATGTWCTSDASLLWRLMSTVLPGDILLGDRAFGAFVFLASLLQRQADGLFRLHQARKLDLRNATKLGKNDWLISLHKPLNQRAPYLSIKEWKGLPQSIQVRVIHAHIPIKGFRTQELWLVTTFLDPVAYPIKNLIALYFRRWDIELSFRHIKTTMGMETLRCLTPAMILKEFLLFLIAHNCLRALIAEAAQTHGVPRERISFKGTVDTLRSFLPELLHARSLRAIHRIRRRLLEILAADLVPLRPNRSEPRAVKHRPKSYPLLTKPRHQFKASIHKGAGRGHQRILS